MQLQMPADLLEVFTAVSVLVTSWRCQRQNLEVKDGRHYWIKNDGNCEVFSISSDLGFLTTCQKTSAYKSVCARVCVCTRTSTHT